MVETEGNKILSSNDKRLFLEAAKEFYIRRFPKPEPTGVLSRMARHFYINRFEKVPQEK